MGLETLEEMDFEMLGRRREMARIAALLTAAMRTPTARLMPKIAAIGNSASRGGVDSGVLLGARTGPVLTDGVLSQGWCVARVAGDTQLRRGGR